MKLCYDIETDGLDATLIWCLVAQNLETKVIYKYSDYDDRLPSISDGVSMLANAELLVGHNIIGFDNRIVDKLYGTSLNDKRCHDTFVMSQVLRYKRNHRHGLAGWGEHLGNSKGSYDDWSQYSAEMLRYCVQDVKVNVDIYDALLVEYGKIYAKNPKIKEGLKVEHDCAVFNAKVRARGWNFETDIARSNLAKMQLRMKHIEETIEPQMGNRTIWIDKEPRTPKFKKNGEYNAHTVNQLSDYFGTTVLPHETHRCPAGTTFQRSKEEPIRLGSLELVKEWLLTRGWVPDEYQRKKIGFEWVTTGPKLTTSSLQKMGPIGEMVDEYTTLQKPSLSH